MGRLNTLEHMKLNEFEPDRKENPYFPFSSKDEWELGKFLYRNLSQMQINDYLKLQMVKDMQPSFRTAEQLLLWLDTLPKGSAWQCTEICAEGYTTKEPVHLYWRDALEVMRDIFGNPAFAEHMMYDPYYIYEGTEHEYGEWMSGNEAHCIQVRVCPCDHTTFLNVPQNELPDGATIVPIILASDKAPVTRMSRDREMHLLFLTIANINSEVRMKATAHAWACIAYTPIPEFLTHPKFHSILEAHVWHRCTYDERTVMTRCIDMVCANLKVAAHNGMFMADALNNTRYLTGEHIDPWKIQEFQVAAKKHHLSGIQLPFWRDWQFSNPVIFLVGEILHSCHKWFFDHVLKWCKWVLGDDELDARYRCHHKYIGTCHFTGVSRVKQMTGCEHQDIQHTIIATIAGVAGPDFVRAIHTIVDFIYRAQAPMFTTSSIQEMETCLEDFHLYKQAILDAGAQRGKTGGIPHFQIPKLELFQSFGSSIQNMGSLIQYTADVSKRLLITHCKNPFLRTNQKTGFTQQIVLCLDHEESICRFDLYTLLHRDDTSLGSILSAEHGSIPHTPLVVPEENCSFTGSATPHNHFLQGFVSDDATTAFHVTRRPDFADKPASYLSTTYCLPDFPLLLLSHINNIAGWLKFRIQMQLRLRPLTILPSQQVQALPPSNEHPHGKCDTVLARITSLFSTPATLVVQVRAVFALSTRGNALPPDLSYPLLYVQCFAFVATPSDQPKIGMYTVRRMFNISANGNKSRVTKV
ncbi:hypothetical protein BKA82DRAFT_3973610 [Pisolithus tinctorius]|nr:hypothetical protein BKA82DRAFT_3973610 [Pisolithus tinctorius]